MTLLLYRMLSSLSNPWVHRVLPYSEVDYTPTGSASNFFRRTHYGTLDAIFESIHQLGKLKA